MKWEDINLKESEEAYMGGFGENRREKWYDIVFKNKRNKKNQTLQNELAKMRWPIIFKNDAFQTESL